MSDEPDLQPPVRTERGRNSKPAPPKKRRSYAADAEDARANFAALRGKVMTALRLLRRAAERIPPEGSAPHALLETAIEELEAGIAEG